MARKKTKIVCTMGPATESDEVLRELILAGMNVARFNFSHGSHEYHRTMIGRVRSISDELGIPIAIMLDTKGPEVRTGLLEDGKKVTLTTGDSVIVTTDDDVIGNAQRFSLDYKNLPKEVKKGSIILIDDGLIGLEVDHVEGTDMHCKIINGGELGEKKGVNVPNVNIGLPSVTEQDRADIMFGCELGIDAIAASFIRDGAAVEEIRNICREMGTPNVQIFPKIESALGVKNFDEILAASNGIMVARGDLGVEIGDPELVAVQKKLIRRSRQLNRVVITATQMMESMISNPMPTRAEVMDVANAVLDGTDAVMLSAETAAGQYPAETVATMAKVCLGAEKMPGASVSHHRMNVEFDDIEETIAMSTMFAANHMKGVSAIIAMSSSGRTPLLMSRISSGLPIFALSRNQETLNLCALYRGVTPVFYNDVSRTMEGAQKAISVLKDKGFLMAGDIVLLTQGAEFSESGTNTCRILAVE